MSDYAPINTAFNREFDNLQSSIMPNVWNNNWNNMDDYEKNTIMNVGHYFYSIHLIVKVAGRPEIVMFAGKNPYSYDRTVTYFLSV